MGDLMERLLQEFSPRWDAAFFVSSAAARLGLALVLGGMIGFERELRRKPAGLRTNMFICFGAAMFTILSERMAGGLADQTRIASQIIPGIGFIGAGSILRSNGGVTGLTTAATLFVVASVGMAAGSGNYLIATFAALVILLALHVLGWVERKYQMKTMGMTYEVAGQDPELVIREVNHALEAQHQMMESVQLGAHEGKYRVHFVIDASESSHTALLQKLRQSAGISHVDVIRGAEKE